MADRRRMMRVYWQHLSVLISDALAGSAAN
jgi:hypothetical protein